MIKKLAGLLGIALMIGGLYGCAAVIGAAAGGAGTAIWLSGKLSDELSAPYERTISATKSALKSLDMAITKDTKTEKVTQIRSEYSDGKDVWIDIRPLTERTSKIEIRVGMTGDKAASGKILERVKRYL